jgi:polar amino acid transport system substrate-binding protein
MRPTHFSRYAALAATLIVLILTGCAAAPTPTATPVPPTATPEPTVEAAPAPAGDEILVVTGEFPPFTGEALDGGGMITEIVAAVFAEMERPIRVEYYPWERVEAMVQSGEAWGAFPYVPSEERRELYMISDNLGNSETYLYYFGDAMQGVTYEELSDLQQYRMGASQGNWYIPLFEEAGLNAEVAADDLANLRKLRAGRIDLFPTVSIIGQWLIQNNFPDEADQFGILEQPLQVDDSQLIQNTVIVSQTYADSEAILTDFNTALATVIENGTYAEIVARYGLTVEQLFGAN